MSVITGTLAEQAAALAARKISSVELTQGVLDRIAAYYGAERVFRHLFPGRTYLLVLYTRHETPASAPTTTAPASTPEPSP